MQLKKRPSKFMNLNIQEEEDEKPLILDSKVVLKKLVLIEDNNPEKFVSLILNSG